MALGDVTTVGGSAVTAPGDAVLPGGSAVLDAGDDTEDRGGCACCGSVGCCVRNQSAFCITFQATGSPFPTLNDGLTLRVAHTPGDPLPPLIYLMLRGKYFDPDRGITVCYTFPLPVGMPCSDVLPFGAVGNPRTVPTGHDNPSCVVDPQSYGYISSVGSEGDHNLCAFWGDFTFFTDPPPSFNAGNHCGIFYWSIFSSVGPSPAAAFDCTSTATATVTVPGSWFTIPLGDTPITFDDFDLTTTISFDPGCEGRDFVPEAAEGVPIGTTFELSADEYAALCDCPPPTWNCVGGACVDPGDGTGEYPTLGGCLTACGVTPSYNCVARTCVDPGDGSGRYNLDDCSAACSAPTGTGDIAGGGDVAFTCCPEGFHVPQTLPFVMSGLAGACPCLSTTGAMAWDNGLKAYVADLIVCGTFASLYFYCDGEGFQVELWCNGVRVIADRVEVPVNWCHGQPPGGDVPNVIADLALPLGTCCDVAGAVEILIGNPGPTP